ncbi:MAG: hypothetical protein FIB08_03695 [Candidatus Methanoperedens sp.]|nr:hypothetical protein [Candidatus Methanoperedens sp.]
MTSKHTFLTYKYSLREINVAMQRLLNVAEQLPRDEPWAIDKISARVGLEEAIVGDCLVFLCDAGIYQKSDNEYIVSGRVAL